MKGIKKFLKWLLIILWPVLVVAMMVDETDDSNNSSFKDAFINKAYPFFQRYVKATFQTLDDEEVVEIKISEKNLEKDRALVESFGSFQKDRLKVWRKGKIKIDGTYQEMKYKLHGTALWLDKFQENDKISKKIKLKSTGPFINNQRRINLIMGEEMNPTVILPNKMAYHMGLIASYGRMKIVEVNGDDQGAYYVVEQIDKNYLEREYGITNYTILKNIADWNRKEYGTGSAHGSDHDLHFGNLETTGTNMQPSIAVGKFKSMVEEIDKENFEGLKQYIDLDYMARYLATAYLFNEAHFMTGDNVKLLWDFTKGRFYPIYRAENGGMEPSDKKNFQEFNAKLFNTYTETILFEKVNHRFFKLLLSNPEFRFLRDQYVYELINKKDSLEQERVAIIAANENVMNHSDLDLTLYRQVYLSQYRTLTTMIQLAERYYSYQKLFISNDKLNKQLHVRSDTYVPVKLVMNGTDSVIIPPIQFDADLRWYYLDTIIPYTSDTLGDSSLVAINMLTKDTLRFEALNYNEVNLSASYDKEFTQQALKASNINYRYDGDTWTINAGTYNVKENIIFPEGDAVKINAGSRLRLGEDVSILVQGNLTAAGTAGRKVIIEAKDELPFGALIVQGAAGTEVQLSHFEIRDGNEAYLNGLQVTGQLAIYHANVSMEHCIIQGSHADDGMNLKYCDANLKHVSLVDNFADQVDFDFCTVLLDSSSFITKGTNDNGDGVDLSGSLVYMQHCNFQNFTDKAVSVGERSMIYMENNHLQNNRLGVAIKDESQVFVTGNTFDGDSLDFTLYIKKQIFKYPYLYLNKGEALPTVFTEMEDHVVKYTPEELEKMKQSILNRDPALQYGVQATDFRRFHYYQR